MSHRGIHHDLLRLFLLDLEAQHHQSSFLNELKSVRLTKLGVNPSGLRSNELGMKNVPPTV